MPYSLQVMPRQDDLSAHLAPHDGAWAATARAAVDPFGDQVGGLSGRFRADRSRIAAMFTLGVCQ